MKRCSTPEESVRQGASTAVLVTPPGERRSRLVSQLGEMGVRARPVTRCREARELFSSGGSPDLVFTDVSLQDGNWASVLKGLVDARAPASLVICTSGADETLWSEAIWRGVHDLLVEPYQAKEFRFVVEGALRAARSRARRQLRRKHAARENAPRVTAAQSGAA